MNQDLHIAEQAKLLPIQDIAKKLDIPESAISYHGKFKAKFEYSFLNSVKNNKAGKLILVTAMSPTPAGEGKTTTTVGLGDALSKLGKRACVCLREPSLGPVFGMKGGAAGGGYAQIVPMADINLHFTGDFASIAAAHNLLSAMIDNHIHHGNELDIDVRRITWKRVVDMNDRALRQIVVGLGGAGNGFPREDGFDIVVASEVMAIFCLAESISDLKNRLSKIIVGYTRAKTPVTAADIKAQGAMTALLVDAFKPNLVQTLEHTPAIIHGGPFANIAHGCNSLSATRLGMNIADFVVTEAGFGADLGAEKFIDIKCRKGDIHPSAVVIVATIRALKYHGGVVLADLSKENVEAVTKGFENLKRHIDNIKNVMKLPCVVALNHFTADTDKEIEALKCLVESMGVKMSLSKHWAKGGEGALDLGREVLKLVDSPSEKHWIYDLNSSLQDKMTTLAQKIYRAEKVNFSASALNQIKQITDLGYGNLPICMAKTQYSFSTDAKKLGAPENHTVEIREVVLRAGAGFVVMIGGDIMTMPGLPKKPSAEIIDVDDQGRITGLF